MNRTHASIGNRVALALIGLALALRVLVPAGWMPSDRGGFAITMCSGSAMESAWVDADGKLHKQAPSSGGGEHCAFAGLGAPMLAGDIPAPAILTPRADAAHARARSLASVGQGLAAPPPPATGPPITA